jgi:hypothetical protein
MTRRVQMDKGRFIGGIICLAVAVLLGILNVRLPAEKLMFSALGENMPWVPVVILGVVGLVLLVTAPLGGQRAETQAPRAEDAADLDKVGEA